MYASLPHFRPTMIASVVAVVCLTTACGGANSPALPSAEPATDVAGTQATQNNLDITGAVTVPADLALSAALVQAASTNPDALSSASGTPVSAAPTASSEPATITTNAAVVAPSDAIVMVAAPVTAPAPAPEPAPVLAQDLTVNETATIAAVTTKTLALSTTQQVGPAMTTSAGCSATGSGDFIDNVNWAQRRLLPRDCAVVIDAQVGFSWTQPKDRDTTAPWTLTLTTQSGTPVLSRTSKSPRLFLEAPLAANKYRWQVAYKALDGSMKISNWRQFEVSATSSQIKLPSGAAYATTVKAKASPRVLPTGSSWSGLGSLIKAYNSGTEYKSLIRVADKALATAVPTPPEARTQASFATTSDYATWLKTTMSLTNDELRTIEALAYAWRISADSRYLAAAKAHAVSLAAWDTDGGSSEALQPQANRNVYTALAIAMDLLQTEFSASERTAIGAAFETRMAAAIAGIDRLDTSPYLPFENTTVSFALQALTLVAGLPEFPRSEAWLARTWELFMISPNPLSEEDGGIASSGAYAWYDLYQMPRTLATVALAANIDPSQRAYIRRMGDFLIATTAPNRPSFSSFGDGTEEQYLYQNYSGDPYRLYAQVTRVGRHEWYWRQRPESTGTMAGYVSPLTLLMLGRKTGATVTAEAPTQNDWFFENVGQAAMHSNVQSSLRSTVQFRSSRFGAYNHGHADQNSFTFTSNGVNLLVNAGYYPYYLSPHHAKVTRATRYKNAVTFDGGIGQAESTPTPTAPTAPVSSMEPRGQIVHTFSDAYLGVVTGDATQAYRSYNSSTGAWTPLLTKAIRTVAYLRDKGVVVVYDNLASVKARTWELNYHSLGAFGIDGSSLIARNGSASACISHHGLAGTLTTSSGFDIAPEATRPEQYHARYTALLPSTDATVVTVIRENCQSVTTSVSITGNRADVLVGGVALRFEGGGTTVPLR